MLQHVQFRDFVQIRKTNVTDTICTMKTVHRVINLWHLSVMRNCLIVTILRVTRETYRIEEKGKKGEGLGRVSSLPFSLSRFPPPLPPPLPSSSPPPPPFAPVTRYLKGQFLAINICFTCDCAGQDRKIRPMASTSCSATFWQLLVFRATFCILSNFSSYLLILTYRNSF